MTTARQEAGVNSHGGVYVVGGAQPAFGSSTDANEVFKFSILPGGLLPVNKSTLIQ